MKWSCAKITGLQKPRQTRIHTGHPVSHQWAHACVFDLGAAHSPSFQAFQSMKAHLSPTKKTHTKPQKSTTRHISQQTFSQLFSFSVGFFRRPSLAAILFLPVALVHHQAMGVQGQDLRTCLCVVVVVVALVVHHLQCHHFASMRARNPMIFLRVNWEDDHFSPPTWIQTPKWRRCPTLFGGEVIPRRRKVDMIWAKEVG